MKANKKIKHILVTGGTGFVGKNLVKELLKSGYQVTVFSRRKKISSNKNISIITVNYKKQNTFKRYLKNFDAIIHLATLINIDEKKQVKKTIDENVSIFHNLLDELKLQKLSPLIILPSTDRLYGVYKGKGKVDETITPFPLDPFTTSKIINEKLIEFYSWQFGFPYAILRIGSIYGPGQRSNMFISDVIKKTLTLNKIPVGDLKVKKNFIYIDDAVKGFKKVLDYYKRVGFINEIINLSTSKITSLEQIADLIKKIIEEKTGKKKEFIFNPKLKRSNKTQLSGFVMSNSKAFRILKWKPRVNFETGLKKTIDYFDKQYYG